MMPQQMSGWPTSFAPFESIATTWATGNGQRATGNTILKPRVGGVKELAYVAGMPGGDVETFHENGALHDRNAGPGETVTRPAAKDRHLRFAGVLLYSPRCC